jgi:hypothetical protein
VRARICEPDLSKLAGWSITWWRFYWTNCSGSRVSEIRLGLIEKVARGLLCIRARLQSGRYVATKLKALAPVLLRLPGTYTFEFPAPSALTGAKAQISLCPLWPDLKSCPDTKQTPPPCTAIRAFMHGPVFPGNRKISNLNSSEVQPSPFDKLRAGSAGLSLEMEFSRPFLALVSPVFCCTIEAVPFVKTAGPAPP